jgi:EAL domain-containing protein (putative c-di-GMP-specific phosphodiesterase class I)/GGDEF domain-containing protein
MAPSILGRSSHAVLARALCFPAAAFACALLGGSVKAAPVIATGGIAMILGGLTWASIRRAGLERLAARASGDEEGSPLAMTLPRLATRLRILAARQSQTHPVTGLPTRERLSEVISADVAAGVPAGLMGVIRFVDYDRLAGFDAATANLALKRFTERLAMALRPGRTIAQVDRDCVGVWFSDGGADAFMPELQAIAYVAGQEIDLDQTVLSPVTEIGMAAYPRDGTDGAQLIIRATATLARPGTRGGQLRLAEPVSAQSARERYALEQDLAQAIAEDQLTMVFQPVVDLGAGRMIGAEALLRWDHPRLGAISPATFIPVVETMGLGERYGLWVLNAACREARRWRELGLEDMKVAVNLSARQLLDPDLRSKIERTLTRHGLSAKALELELTETAAMADADRTAALFGELRQMGVSLAIDDFGSGYSSLSYLKNLPFDKLKIDREFVTAVDQRGDSRAICSALIALGKGLGLLVLAEGVETEAEVGELRRLGCDVFQGYHFSKPLSAEAFRALAVYPAWRARLARAAGVSSPIQGLQIA